MRKQSRKYSTSKIGEHVPCRCSISTKWAFDSVENKHNLYRGEDYMKRFSSSLRDHAANVINLEKKKMLPLTKKRTKITSRCDKMLHLQKKNPQKFAKEENYRNVRDHCHFTGKYRDAAHGICNLRFNVPNRIPAVFHSGSNYDYHFIIKESVNEFHNNLKVLGRAQRSTKCFSVPIEKEIS